MHRTPTPATSTSRGGLSRERIARGALELLDREGVDALTMRRLAAELGVGTMTLYGYFRTKEELIDAAVDAATEEAGVRVRGSTWREQLGNLMRDVRRELARHPAGVRIRLSRPLLSPGALRITEAGMRVLESAGFGKRRAARAYETLLVYTLGFATFCSPDSPEDVKRQARAAVAALPRDEYPAVTGAGRELTETLFGDAQFEFGLERLLDGLEASPSGSERR